MASLQQYLISNVTPRKKIVTDDIDDDDDWESNVVTCHRRSVSLLSISSSNDRNNCLVGIYRQEPSNKAISGDVPTLLCATWGSVGSWIVCSLVIYLFIYLFYYCFFHHAFIYVNFLYRYLIIY
jgi:hypothetical protein